MSGGGLGLGVGAGLGVGVTTGVGDGVATVRMSVDCFPCCPHPDIGGIIASKIARMLTRAILFLIVIHPLVTAYAFSVDAIVSGSSAA
jgi:hypothetical protein